MDAEVLECAFNNICIRLNIAYTWASDWDAGDGGGAHEPDVVVDFTTGSGVDRTAPALPRAEIEEVLLFMCAYAGFNKAAGCFGVLNELLK